MSRPPGRRAFWLAEEMLAGMPAVTAFGYNNEAIARFEKTNQELYECGQSPVLSLPLTNPTTRLVNNAAYVLVEFWAYLWL